MLWIQQTWRFIFVQVAHTPVEHTQASLVRMHRHTTRNTNRVHDMWCWREVLIFSVLQWQSGPAHSSRWLSSYCTAPWRDAQPRYKLFFYLKCVCVTLRCLIHCQPWYSQWWLLFLIIVDLFRDIWKINMICRLIKKIWNIDPVCLIGELNEMNLRIIKGVLGDRRTTSNLSCSNTTPDKRNKARCGQGDKKYLCSCFTVKSDKENV